MVEQKNRTKLKPRGPGAYMRGLSRVFFRSMFMNAIWQSGVLQHELLHFLLTKGVVNVMPYNIFSPDSCNFTYF